MKRRAEDRSRHSAEAARCERSPRSVGGGFFASSRTQSPRRRWQPVLKSPGLAAGHRRSRMEFERKWVPSGHGTRPRPRRREPPRCQSQRGPGRIRCPRPCPRFRKRFLPGIPQPSQGLADPWLCAAQSPSQIGLAAVLARVEEFAKPCGTLRRGLRRHRLWRCVVWRPAVAQPNHGRELQRHQHPSVSPGGATKFSQSRTDLQMVMGFPS